MMKSLCPICGYWAQNGYRCETCIDPGKPVTAHSPTRRRDLMWQWASDLPERMRETLRQYYDVKAELEADRLAQQT